MHYTDDKHLTKKIEKNQIAELYKMFDKFNGKKGSALCAKKRSVKISKESNSDGKMIKSNQFKIRKESCMKQCQKCGAICTDTESICQKCGMNLSASPDSPNRYHEFVKLLRKNVEEKLNKLLYFYFALMAICDVCILFSPLAVYGNGTTISKEKHYSVITMLSEGMSGSETPFGLFLFASVITSVGVIYALLCVTKYAYAENEKTTKKSFICGIVASLVGSIGSIVATVSFLSLPNAITRAMGLSNPYWKLSYGWGGFVTLGLLYTGVYSAAAFLIIISSLKRKYINGTYTEEDFLKIFFTNKKTTTANSVSEQLKELDQLKKDGLISEADYEEKKKQILNL